LAHRLYHFRLAFSGWSHLTSPLTQIAPFELRITDPPGAQRLTVNRW
jgi:hypothetical protein